MKNVLKSCLPRDTINEKMGFFVKYILSDSTYNIQVKIKNKTKYLGYQFDCNVPLSIVPYYEWSNNNILSLRRSCGTFCSINLFFQIKNNELYEFEKQNVLCYDKDRSLIAYILDDTIVIENLMNGQKKVHSLTGASVCNYSIIECISECKFIKHYFKIEYSGLKKNIRTKLINKILLPQALLDEKRR
ncbi:hypothetical protein [Emticicia aquatilis]|nr:hypothetical protein [Emticicia aquatilis]